jgi:hypothetical protein
MNKILDFIHKSIALFVAFTVLICIDLPCKVLAVIFLIVLAIIVALFYPLFKKIKYMPNFVDAIYDYGNSSNLIAKKVYKEWIS